MNQKNIFTAIGVVLLIQGIIFYATGDKMMSDIFPTLDTNGHSAAVTLLQVMAVLSAIVGLISLGAKNSPQVLWAYTLGFALFSVLSLKHKFMEHIDVPVFAIVIQLAITLLCAWLWMQSRKSRV